MTLYQKIGIAVTILGIGMFFVGASLFSYQGPTLSPIISDIGMYSFLIWLPTIITGLIVACIRKRKPGHLKRPG